MPNRDSVTFADAAQRHVPCSLRSLRTMKASIAGGIETEERVLRLGPDPSACHPA